LIRVLCMVPKLLLLPLLVRIKTPEVCRNITEQELFIIIIAESVSTQRARQSHLLLSFTSSLYLM